MTDPGHILLACLPALPVAVFMHELGHVLAGRASGFVVTSFGLGIGRPLFVIPVGGMRVYACLVRPLQGITFAFLPQLHPTRLQLVAFTAGGILANAVAAAFSLACSWMLPWGSPFWIAFAAINAILAVSSLIPYHYSAGQAPLRTDGALILQALRSGTLSTSAPRTIQTASSLRGLWASIGDTLILRVYLLSAASAWVELGDLGRAEALFRDAESTGGKIPPHIEALAALVRAEIAIGRRLSVEAESALVIAEAIYRRSGQPAGLYLVDLLRVSMQSLEGDAARAAETLEALASDPVAKSHPELGMATLTVRLAVACSGSNEGAVEQHLARYEADRPRWPSATRDLRLYRVLARFHSGRGDRASAEAAYRNALVAVKGVADGWADAEGRRAFLEAQSALIEDARLCLQDGPEPEEAERVIGALATTRPIDPWPAKDQRFRRWGLRGMLANVVACAAAAMLATIVEGEKGGPIIFLAVLLALFTILGALYLGLDLTIGRLVPALRRFSGAILVILACYPWLGALAIYILSTTVPDR
ncbi:MAG: hypothetical protein JWN86_3354 [Planctomycetota bacterium]|nr:hypothetical protein [Planctomycetota bacterium]